LLSISRRCVPYTPFARELTSASVTLVSAAGIHLSTQDPFPAEDPGDISYREIPSSVSARELRITHHHYDHSEADTDPNIVFPIDTLRELVADGLIGGVAETHFSYGFTTRLKDLYENTFPEIADKIERTRTKLVLLTAGCPETCHRSVATLAREIEGRGISTLIISASPAATESIRPPRAVAFSTSSIGRVIGAANDREQHRTLVLEALQMFRRDLPPGRVVPVTINTQQLVGSDR